MNFFLFSGKLTQNFGKFFIKFAQYYIWFIQNFLRILKIPKIYIKFFLIENFFRNVSKYLKAINFFFFNFGNTFLVVFQTFSLILSKFLYYFHFLKIITKFSEKQVKLYLKSTLILLITKIS